jgi:hypothetical protein
VEKNGKFLRARIEEVQNIDLEQVGRSWNQEVHVAFLSSSLKVMKLFDYSRCLIKIWRLTFDLKLLDRWKKFVRDGVSLENCLLTSRNKESRVEFQRLKVEVSSGIHFQFSMSRGFRWSFWGTTNFVGTNVLRINL